MLARGLSGLLEPVVEGVARASAVGPAARRSEPRVRLEEVRDRSFYQRTMWPAGRVLVNGGSAAHSPAGSVGS